MKLFHSLKFQFTLLFTVLIISICLTTTFLGIRQLSSAVEETFAAQGISIVERAASYINGNSFESLSASLDVNDLFYENTRRKLKDLKDYSGCLYLYTIAPFKGNIWHYIIDGSAEPYETQIFAALGEEDDINEYDDAFLKSFNSQVSVAGDLSDQGGWGWLISIYTPIFNSSGKVVGMIVCDFDGTHLHETIIAKQRQSAFIGIISLLFGIALIVFFLYRIFSPLLKFNVILKEIAFGEGDLTKRININNKNEIGELAGYFNMTLDKIINLIIAIKDEAANLNNTGNSLALNMHETASAMYQITEHLQNIRKMVINQSASVSQTHSTMEQVSANIEKLEVNVEAQTASVSRSSSAIEEMIANIQNVTKTLVRNSENVQELINVSDLGRSSLQKVTHDINEIAKESEGLLKINSVMENISSQTNLLSMNAAIEAAHAGESGKGFAVVASEIRKLAGSASEQSRTISDVLKKIKNAIDAITLSASVVFEKFQAIDERVRIVSDQETIIRQAMEEQGQGSRQILEDVSILNERTRMVKKDSLEMLGGSKEVISESETLDKATKEITEGMNEMAAGTEEVNSAVKHINEITTNTKKHIEILFNEISRFKVD